jgi:hypothetical protein
MRSELGLKLVEFVLWVVAAAAVVVLAAGAVGLLVGGDLLTVKYTLFTVGVLLFGVGSLAIQPESPGKRGRKRVSEYVDLEADGPGGIEAYIQRVPPLRDNHLPFDRRVSRSVKIFVTSLAVLGVSLVMEFLLDVQV